MSPLLRLLGQMRGRLGMYLGTPSLSRLAAFLRGYDLALLEAGNNDSFLADFRRWIQERYRSDRDAWEELIRAQCRDEAEALDAFWQLVDEFQMSGNGARGIQPAAKLTDE